MDACLSYAPKLTLTGECKTVLQYTKAKQRAIVSKFYIAIMHERMLHQIWTRKMIANEQHIIKQTLRRTAAIKKIHLV